MFDQHQRQQRFASPAQTSLDQGSNPPTNIGVPSSISPRGAINTNSKKMNTYSETGSSQIDGDVHVIDDQNIQRISSPATETQNTLPTQTRHAKRAEKQAQASMAFNQKGHSPGAKDIVISEGNLSDNNPQMEIKNENDLDLDYQLKKTEAPPVKREINKDQLRYLFWRGYQIFMCDGKLQFGINLWQPICTFVIITAIQLSFIFNTLAELASTQSGYNPYIAVSTLLLIATDILLVLTASKDPATIPMRDYLMAANQNALDNPTEHILERRKYLAIHGPYLTKMKYCFTCDIYRPPRTVHCGICNCCIERLDHHCPWLGTCVGKRNYKYFISFVSLIALLIIQSVTFCAIHISDESFYIYEKVMVPKDGDENSLEEVINWKYSRAQNGSIGIMSCCLVLGIFVFWLCGFHQILLCRNETTNENLKGSYKKLGNPFQRGICDNLRRLFRRDKRNWHPEIEVVKLEREEILTPRRRTKQRSLVRMSTKDRRVPPKRIEQQDVEKPDGANKKRQDLALLYGQNVDFKGTKHTKTPPEKYNQDVPPNHQDDADDSSDQPIGMEDIMLNHQGSEIDQQISILDHTDQKPQQQISKLDLSGVDQLSSEGQNDTSRHQQVKNSTMSNGAARTNLTPTMKNKLKEKKKQI